MTTAPIALGVDGCPTGWIAAVAYADETEGRTESGDRSELRNGGRLRSELRLYDIAHGGLAALVEECERMNCRRSSRRAMQIVAVDVPMGLPARAGLRPCDAAARAMLGRRWPCVFPAPDRELLGQTFEAARAIVVKRRAMNAATANPIMTKQAMAIAPKIAEADALVSADPQRQRWLIEVHPELSFLTLARELERPEALSGLPRKKRSAGRAVRRQLIAEVFPDSPEKIDAAIWARKTVGADDVLDAYAGLWSALRFRRERQGQGGGPLVLGDGTHDERGLVMQMVV